MKTWNLVEKTDLFREIQSDSGKYRSQKYVAEMISLLGSPPKELTDREREGLGWRFKPEVENSEGKLCGNACEFYGGPFFDSEGNVPWRLTQHKTKQPLSPIFQVNIGISTLYRTPLT
jgi:hypothetical protein